jgi:hypothetical protein
MRPVICLVGKGSANGALPVIIPISEEFFHSLEKTIPGNPRRKLNPTFDKKKSAYVDAHFNIVVHTHGANATSLSSDKYVKCSCAYYCKHLICPCVLFLKLVFNRKPFVQPYTDKQLWNAIAVMRKGEKRSRFSRGEFNFLPTVLDDGNLGDTSDLTELDASHQQDKLTTSRLGKLSTAQLVNHLTERLSDMSIAAAPALPRGVSDLSVYNYSADDLTRLSVILAGLGIDNLASY